MSFHTDLERGKKIEIEVLQQIKERYPSATLIHAYKGYDIWIPEKGFGVEVKYDPMSNETGNIVLEFEFNNKPSAILTTTARYWVFYDDKEFVWMTPAQIIYCIFNSKQSYASFVGQGDNALKKAFLINKKVLFAYSERDV